MYGVGYIPTPSPHARNRHLSPVQARNHTKHPHGPPAALSASRGDPQPTPQRLSDRLTAPLHTPLDTSHAISDRSCKPLLSQLAQPVSHCIRVALCFFPILSIALWNALSRPDFTPCRRSRAHTTNSFAVQMLPSRAHPGEPDEPLNSSLHVRTGGFSIWGYEPARISGTLRSGLQAFTSWGHYARPVGLQVYLPAGILRTTPIFTGRPHTIYVIDSK